MSNASDSASAGGTDVAVVGMTCRFPGARNLDEFWRNLRGGVESVTYFTDEELEAAGVDRALLRRPDYVRAAAVLDDAALFDASFFGYTPREAELMDPQHRVFLECAWEALDHAGYDPERYKGWVGVYAGAAYNSYLINQLQSNRELLASLGYLQALISNEKDYLTSRVSYKLNLRGPSVNVQTACSTSLVAVHLACQSLLSYQCDMALAGGVSVYSPQRAGYIYQEDGIQSPDGHTRSFDARAQGTMFGSGVGIVVLKRLEDALADGDTIHAVIKGTAINNDGSLKVGYTAPSVDGLSKVIALALGGAGVEPESVSYVEAHGTATALGDPVEVAALNKAFRNLRGKGVCALGSVKTNFGHLNAAAGVAGLIKTVLSLKHRQIPPSLHFARPNPDADWENGPFRVNTTLTEWVPGRWPRRAGVNSMGMGGTNAHVVVEEAPEPCAPCASRPWQLLLLSAKTETALEAATERLAAHLERHPEQNLADIAYTLQVGRKGFAHRRALVCQDAKEAAAALRARDPRRVLDGLQAEEERPVVFMFPGQGAQHVNAGLALYEGEPDFRRHVEECSALLTPHLGFDLRDVLYPAPGREGEADERLKQTGVAQPALFVVEYALARLLMSWGVRPAAMIGHSLGEYVAACLAGVFTIEEGLRLVSARGRLMQGLPPGSMLAVSLPAARLEEMALGTLSLAAVNGETQCVVSGPEEAVAAFEERLVGQGVECRRLHTSHAFHSGMMDGILDAFTEAVRKVELRRPQLPYLSNVTGRWVTDAEATDAGYWARHLRSTVRFAEGARLLLEGGEKTFVEVGPGEALGSLVRQMTGEGSGPVSLPTLGHRREAGRAHERLLKTVGRLWSRGGEVDWGGYYAGESRRRVPLPTYPFERHLFWVESAAAARRAAERSEPGRDGGPSEHFYIPSWKRVHPAELDDGESSPGGWVVFADDCGVGERVAGRLAREGQEVVVVRAGEGFTREGRGAYRLNPRDAAGYESLLAEVHRGRSHPLKIMHLWSLTGGAAGREVAERFEGAQEKGFYSLLHLARALARLDLACAPVIGVVTDGAQEVTGEEELMPEKAAVLGFCRVLGQEHPEIECRSIDVLLPLNDHAREERLAERLIAELNSRESVPVVAYRGSHRWVQGFEPIRPGKAGPGGARLREGGVYLITDGLCEAGLLIAKHLTESVRPRLVLTVPQLFPAGEAWARWLAEHEESGEVSRRIKALLELEAAGAEVLVVSTDAADAGGMGEVLRQTRERFGALHGVIHLAGMSEELIPLHNAEEVAVAFAAKAKGALALNRLAEEARPDFIVLCSSFSSVAGGVGRCAAAAAHSFFDALACAAPYRPQTRALSVNWCDWEQSREAEGFGALAAAGEDGGRTVYASLTENGGAALSVALHTGLRRVIISDGELRIEPGRAAAPAQAQALPPLAEPSHLRPELETAYAAPANEIEKAVAEIWQGLFGIERVGVHDDFFDLGGSSLTGIQVISRLRESFQIDIPLDDLFESPTVSRLAGIIAEKLAQKEEPDAMAELLAEMEALSEEEAQQQLDSRGL